MTYNVLIVGVGGQGVLLASRVIGEAAMREGHEVVMSEVHGMAQRGGSVSAVVRFGQGVLSPLVPKAGADRSRVRASEGRIERLPTPSKDRCLLTNRIVPMTIAVGASILMSDCSPPKGRPQVISFEATRWRRTKVRGSP
jgi:indolepyruvate ferredoxin oxidoreductase beta subunit